jgi:hypothetical protein
VNCARIERDGRPIVEITGGLARVDDALEVISACYEADTDRVLVEAGALPPEFFALQTRFAGEFLQKLGNYGVRLAGVFPDESPYSERFREFLREARTGRGFRAFGARDDAERWLAA